ncbi:MAG TPA: MmcQ/YjbR family DNA-binding protein [Candidatus Omnitrophota bacterium]|nr:MmcQ/YjbR family DNA-binding protein [Candidatus Omnitrophota bacterium]
MAKKEIELKKIPRSKVAVFKIRNRKGFAAVCENNLTEGISEQEALRRMNVALKRMGLVIG